MPYQRPLFLACCASLALWPALAASQIADDSALLGDLLSDEPADATDVFEDDTEYQFPLRFRLESSARWTERRTQIPQPPSEASKWSRRLRFVGEGTVFFGSATSLRLNVALTVNRDDVEAFDAETDVKLDLREAYLHWQAGPSSVQLGRINIRNGSAFGYNPVDFFRLQSADERTNLDPTEARQNRLGVVGFQYSHIWATGAASLTFAPEIVDGPDHLHDEPIYGLNISSTNPTDRVLFAITQEITEGFSPEAYVYWDDGDVSYGLSGSLSFGDRWIVYGEWSGGQKRDLIDSQLYEDRRNGTIAPALTALLGDDDGKRFIHQAALGFSYSTPSNIVTSVEYHYNGRGLSAGDWDDYFDAAKAAGNNPRAAGQLAGIPLASALAQEPVSQHSLFVRSVFTDVVPDLSITALGTFSLIDESGSVQLQADYDFNERRSLFARVGGTFGSDESDFGSRSQKSFFEIGYTAHF